MEDKVQKLKDKISALREADPKSARLAEYEAELKKLTKGSATATAGAFVIPDATEEDYETAGGSKFAQAGLHLSEFGMPYEKTPGLSLAFPFTIVGSADKGKESEIFAGLSKAALWKLKEILTALGVETVKTKGGGIGFDFAEVAGKQAQVLWTTQKDTRPISEGGTGSSYTKPTSVLPIGAEIPEELL
jgi:hypothetical protein